jgi:hypothetical protein
VPQAINVTRSSSLSAKGSSGKWTVRVAGSISGYRSDQAARFLGEPE